MNEHLSSEQQEPDLTAQGSISGAFFAAFQFLTIMPPIIRRSFTLPELGRAVGFYPLVGLVLGALLAGVALLLDPYLSPILNSALLLALWVLLTGGLHIDGLLDSADGIFGGNTLAQRLKIMRDERIGAYGTIAGILLLLLKFSALLSMSGITPLLLALTVGRWSITLAISAFPYARPQGLGSAIHDNSNWWQFVFSSAITLAAVWFIGGWLGLTALGCAGVITIMISRFSQLKLGGLTGDVYGAICEISELACLIILDVVTRL
jgi:adenosylcobinamide-GDP ribazoletransferase